MRWQPIEGAPKDGRVIWAKGNNWGDPKKGEHFTFAFWHNDNWIDAADNNSRLLHLTHWAQHETDYQEQMGLFPNQH